MRVARWEGRPEQRGTVVILAGRAEFIERYFETVAELLARGFAVVALDWRGQGMSERQLGQFSQRAYRRFEIYERDLVALRDQILTPLCPKPWFALGHSMGAAVLLAQAHAGRSPFARLVLTSPMIDLYLLRFKAGARLFIEGPGHHRPRRLLHSRRQRPVDLPAALCAASPHIRRNAPCAHCRDAQCRPATCHRRSNRELGERGATIDAPVRESRLCAQDADTGARDCHRRRPDCRNAGDRSLCEPSQGRPFHLPCRRRAMTF